MITVRRRSGLAVPFEPPELSAEAAIGRSWHRPQGGALLLPKERQYLPAYPLPRPWGGPPHSLAWYFAFGPGPVFGPIISGLPAL